MRVPSRFWLYAVDFTIVKGGHIDRESHGEKERIFIFFSVVVLIVSCTKE